LGKVLRVPKHVRGVGGGTCALVVAGAVVALVVGGTARAAFPGANGRIAFTRDLDVWTVAADGSDAVNLTQHGALDADQRWSPDGARIVFTSDRSGNRDVWVMDADGGNPTRLTTDPAEDLQPAWSPDGTKILFMTDRDGDREIYVMDADGTNPVNLTNSPGTDDDDEAQWSPDGTTISFYRASDVWLMDADGSNQRNATNAPGSADFDQNWSPDGTKMVFDSDRDGDREIFLMDADGANQVQLTFNGDRDSQPVFSPDGTKILFESDRDGDDQLYVMDVDGKNQQRLVESATDDREPDWQPIVPSTTTTSSTTTTTLPGIGGTPVAGKKLLLKDKPDKPQARALKLIAKDAGIGAGAENGGTGDPTLYGGFLKVISTSGDGFNTTYDLPAANWRTKGKPGKNKGYKLKKAGPVKTVLVKLGKNLKVVAKGEALGHTLGADPNPVHVALGLGSQTYCFTFGGQAKFRPGKTYLAKQAPMPGECAALVPQCGDGLVEEGESCPTLDGPADGPAIDATSNYEGEPGVTMSEVEGDLGVVRTRVEVEFAETATVGQVSAVLAQLGGDIVIMLANVPLLEVRIPDPGSLAALDTLIASANGDPDVRVGRGFLMDDDVLPGNFPLAGTVDLSKIDNHLAVGAAAAWNARAAIQSIPLVVVGDGFGEGPPNADTAVQPLDPSDFGGLLSPMSEHGYHVLGIIAARFGGSVPCVVGATGSAALRGCATGMFPAAGPPRIPLRVADNRALLTALGFRMAIVLRATTFGNVVTNTSQNECFSGMCGDPAIAGDRARQWALMVRGAGLESRMLHLTSAGNINDATLWVTDAQTNSSFSAAAVLPAIPTFSGTGTIPNLANTLVVENVVNGAPQEFTPRCLASSSKRGGQLSGIGQFVWSLIDSSSGAGNKTGTSMATPQVAGLATYLWSLDPTMTVGELRGLLLGTTRPVTVSSSVAPCDASSTQPAPIIDAYAAVLALDEAALPTAATAPVRHAIMDADDDGDFDGDDIDAFLLDLVDPDTNLIFEPSAPKFERWDLNGDGYTGGASRTMPFDLDRVGSTQYGPGQLGLVTQMIEGTSWEFDETGLTDLEILCYYGYSGLYDGDDAGRSNLLGPCTGVTMSADFPSVVRAGQPETLLVRVGTERGGGSAPLPDVYIELTPDDATVSPSSGTTDAQGEFSSQVTLLPGHGTLGVVVQALTEPGGIVLAERVVSASGCGYAADQLPPGSYLQTCNSCMVTGAVLECSCRRIDGTFEDTIIDFSICDTDEDLANQNGNLSCTECDGITPSTTTTSTTTTSTTTITSSSTSSSTSVPSTTTLTTTTTTTPTTTTTLVALPVTPYRRYAAAGPNGPTVQLDDEFGTATVDLGTVVLELPPVTIDGLLPPDPDTHQTCYAHPGGVLDDCIDVQNDFGSAPLRVGNPVAVCVPELFPAISVDAFQCYAADGEALGVAATLEDEFQTQVVTLGTPELVCVPVAVDGSSLVDAGRYLVCYATMPTGAVGGEIQVENALHAITVDVGAATGVCVPAVRQLVVSCDLCGNGTTDASAGEECDDGNVTSGDGCSAVCRTE